MEEERNYRWEGKNAHRALSIFRLIRERGPLSRRELARLAGVSLPTLGKYLRDFQRKGWIAEIARGGRGKRGVGFFGLNPFFGPSLGIEVGGKSLHLVVTNLRGDIFFVKNEVVGAENILTTLEACIGEALSRWDLQAIGIASSGIVEARRGFSIRSPRRKDMDNVPLRELYEQKFGLPVYVDDVSRSAAFAEWQLGILQGERCFLYLFLDEGVGLAWLVDGVFYYGPFGIAGEVGHCVIEENGSLCGCGNRGCLETFASTEAIVRKVQEALRLGVVSSLAGQEVSMVSIIREAERGDKLCYSLLTEAGEYVGKAMAQVVNLTGIPLIVLGGQLCKAKEFITEPIIRMVRANALAFLGDRLEIRIAMLDEYAGAMGVAMQALSEVLGRVAKG